jgi:UDP-hydrolysing UDP-N-acetyl-D-glucosamine 2-epimerase
VKTIGVITAGRSDYGIYLPVLREIEKHPQLLLRVFVTGMHLSPEFGYTVQSIVDDGFDICERVEMLVASDTPAAIAKSIGIGIAGFAQVFSRSQPDILLVLGDRFEMYAAAVAALPFRIPIAHIHGGELTQGAIDDVLRHSLTKLSHLHFASTDVYARRIQQLGEDPRRVFVTGAPGIDNLKMVHLLGRAEIEEAYRIQLPEPPLLVTFHPVTLEPDETESHITELLAALANMNRPVVFTLPNADTGGRIISERIKEFVRRTESAFLVENLGLQGYFSMMSVARAMVGNSSSGIIEAASFALPVINIGSRQKGRSKGQNVVDVGYSRSEIFAGIERVCCTSFFEAIKNMANPYGEGEAAGMIAQHLAGALPAEELLIKEFNDIEMVRAVD